MERRELYIKLSELKEFKNMETNGCREDGSFFDVIYREDKGELQITYFDDGHFVQDVIIELNE